MPSLELLEAMGNFNQELIDAGLMLAGEGIKPTSQGKRVAVDGDDRTVIDGPFAATSELVAGFWIWQVKDMDEAMEWAIRCPNPMPRSQAKSKSVPSMRPRDFVERMTPELKEQEDRMRDVVEGR